MPLPLVPVFVRIGLAAAAGYGLARLLAARAGEGRHDQRAEDALDDLDEGVLLHHLRQPDLPGAQRPDLSCAQRNATLRFRRIIGFRGREWELDAGLIARLRLRERRVR